MKTIIKGLSYILPAILFCIITPITLLPLIQRELLSGWERGEFYITVAIQILFFLCLSIYLHFNIQNTNWTQRYGMNTIIFFVVGLYYYASLSYDPAFPTLVGLSLIITIYIIPILLITQSIAILIQRLGKK